MGAIINKYKASGNLVLDLPFNQGTLLDRSGNANNATPNAASGVNWQNGRKSRGIRVYGTGGLVVADSASMRYLEVTVSILLERGLADVAQRLYCHRDGTGTRLDLYYSAGGTLTLGTTAGTSNWTYAFNGSERTITFRMYSTAKKPDLFINGVYKGTGSAGLAVNNAAKPTLTIGNYYALTAQPTTAPISHVVAINTASVTNQEIASLHEELMAENGGLNQPTRNFVFPVPVATEASCVLDTDFSVGPDGKVVDRKGNYPGTIIKTCSQKPGAWNRGLATSNGGYVNFGDITQLNGASKATVEFVGRMDATPASAYGTLWYKATSSTYKFGLICQIGTENVYVACANGANTYASITGGAPAGSVQHYVLVFDGTQSTDATKVKLYINGVLQSLSITGPFPTTIADLATRALGVSQDPTALSSPTDQTAFLMRVYSDALSASDVARKYNEYAKCLKLRDALQGVPVTLANVTAGTIPFTGANVVSGSFKVSDDGTRKWYECASTGGFYIPFSANPARGTLVFDFYKVSAAASIVVTPIASIQGIPTATGQNGYILIVGTSGNFAYQRITNGAADLTAWTSATSLYATSTRYRIAISMDIFGVMTTYIKGGAFTSWTRIPVTSGSNPYTGTAYTQSRSIGINMGANDKIGNILWLPFINPTLNPELIPE